MKNSLRIMSVLIALVLCVGAFAACGGTEAQPATVATTPATTGEVIETTVPFIAPPDQIGLVISADSQLVTWQAYKTSEETIDFKGVDLKALGEAGEMSLVYLEAEVSYYSLVGGKLVAATLEEVVPGSVIGITTLEEGVMEVYILSVPVEEDESYEDPMEDFVEEVIPTESAATEPDSASDPDED